MPLLSTIADVDAARAQIDECLDKLVATGSTSQVALELEAHGVRGYCGNAAMCVLAAHVMAETGYFVLVCERGIGFGEPSFSMKLPERALDDLREYATETQTRLPSVLADFIKSFDLGYYPDLIGGPREH